MARIFLSHASADKPKVRKIADALRQAGHDPWLDEEQIEIGESIPAAVARGLAEAEFVMLCLSAVALTRRWVQTESDDAFAQQMNEGRARILPVRLEDVQPPPLLRAIAYADLFPDDATFRIGIQRVLRAIIKHATPAHGKNGFTQPAPAAAPVAPQVASNPGMAPSGGLPPGYVPPSPDTVDLFLSYAPSDTDFARALDTQLAMLKRQKLIRALHRGQVGPGMTRDAIVAAQLDGARIVVVLMSSAYLASDDCYDVEMERALTRHREGKARVIPILIRETEGWKKTPLGALQALPRSLDKAREREKSRRIDRDGDMDPVEAWKSQDEAWAEIARELRKVVQEILGLPESS